MNRITSPEPDKLRWPRRIAAALLALLAVGGMTLSAGLLVGHGLIDQRVQRLAGELGLSMTVDHVDLGFGRPTTAHRLTVSVPGGPQMSLAAAEANLDLLDLAEGKRRPSQTTLRGLRLAFTVTRDGVEGLGPVLDAWNTRQSKRKPPTSEPSKPQPLSLKLEDARVHMRLRDPKLPPLDLVIEELAGSLKKTGPRIAASFSGAITLGGKQRRGTLEAVLEGRRLVEAALTIDERIHWPLEYKGRRFVASIMGVRRDAAAGTTELTGLAITDGIHSGGAKRILLADRKGVSTPDGLPRPRDIVAVLVEKGEAKRDRDSASADSLSVTMSWRDGEVLPRLGLVTATNAKVDSPDRQLAASVASLNLAFKDIATATLLNARTDPSVIAEVLKSVTLKTPTATVTAPKGQLASILPTRLRKYLPGAKADRRRRARPTRTKTANRAGALGARRLVKLMRPLPLTIVDGLVEFRERGVGSVLTLDNVGLKTTPGADDSLGVEVDAMIVRAGQPTGQVHLTTSVNREGRPTVAKGLVAGQDFAHLVSKFSKYVSVPPEADLEIAFNWTPPTTDEPLHKLTGKAKLRNFGFEAWRVSHVPISGIKGEVQYTVTFDPKRKQLALHLPKIQLAEARMDARLDLTLPQDGEKPKFAARLTMPKQDCAAVRRSIPAALLPRLTGLKVRGSMWFDARINVDMDQPKKLTLDVLGSMDSCAVLTLGEQIDLSKLKGRRYVHHPVEPKLGERKDISVGPGTSQWVSSRSMPRFVKSAAIVTEDRGYWKHGGVRWVLVRRALKLNLKHGRFVYGGSTITQQLIKNLYLSREKTLGRKLEEAIIAMQMEREFTKDEILTLYINVVEYGPNIYGVKKAARHYFGKHPRHLSPLEAAFIMGLKPWPRGGYKQWLKGTVNAYWVKRLRHILDMMHRREGGIDVEEVEEAAPYQPNFRPQGASHSWGKPYKRPE